MVPSDSICDSRIILNYIFPAQFRHASSLKRYEIDARISEALKGNRVHAWANGLSIDDTASGHWCHVGAERTSDISG